MNIADFGVALILFLIVLGFTLYGFWGPLRREKNKIERYPLFAIRDDLVRLVAEGKIDEKGDLFPILYRGINQVIPRVKPLTLSTFVSALINSPYAEEAFVHKLCLASLNKDPSVRKVVKEFFKTLDEILLARSIFVYVSNVGRFRPGWAPTADEIALKLRPVVSWISKTQSSAYDVHRIMTTAKYVVSA